MSCVEREGGICRAGERRTGDAQANVGRLWGADAVVPTPNTNKKEKKKQTVDNCHDESFTL